MTAPPLHVPPPEVLWPAVAVWTAHRVALTGAVVAAARLLRIPHVTPGRALVAVLAASEISPTWVPSLHRWALFVAEVRSDWRSL